MSLLTGRGYLTVFDNDHVVIAFAVFDEPPVSSSRAPDDVYTRTENGWTSESGLEFSVGDIAELDGLATGETDAAPTP